MTIDQLQRASLAVAISFLLLLSMPLFGEISTPVFSLRSALWAQSASTGISVEATPVEEAPITKPCSSCHSEETAAWERSLHAAESAGSVGATCTDCHSEYVRGHPDEGMIPLVTDSSNCSTCHADTYEQWQHSQHAGEGVQCISCHSAHDQELRLTDDKLCSSCHRESLDDPLHQAHWQGEATCTSCHLADMAATESVASSDQALAMSLAPTHDFVTVSAANCLDCHRDDVNSDDVNSDDVNSDDVSSDDVSSDDVSSEVNGGANGALALAQAQSVQAAPELSSQLESAEKSNTFLTVLSTVNLGFGIGIGGILGVLFVLVAATMNKRGGKA